MAITTIEWTMRRLATPANLEFSSCAKAIFDRFGGRLIDNGATALFPGFTFNPWRGCVEAPDSPACDHCYARELAKRNPKTLGEWGKGAYRAIATEDYWKLPHQWNMFAREMGVELNVFSLSLGDWLEDHAGLIPHRARLLLVISQTPWLRWLLLTKRPERWYRAMMEVYEWVSTNDNPLIRQRYAELADMVLGWAQDGRIQDGFQNIRIGVTIEWQPHLKPRFMAMLQIPATGYFISAEPLLGPLTFAELDYLQEFMDLRRVNGSPVYLQIITGGESGAGERTRPSHPAWFEDLCHLSQRMGASFFFKQWGDWAPRSGTVMKSGKDWGKEDPGCQRWTSIRMDESGRDGRTGEPLVPGKLPPDMGHHAYMQRVGKANAGRILLGQEWNQELTVGNGLEAIGERGAS